MFNEDVIKRISKKFEVIEDNGGGLTLAVFNDKDSDKVVFLHTGYEYYTGQLVNDLIELANDADPEKEWDGCEENPQEIYNDFQRHEYGCTVIVDNDGLYPSKMGTAGLREFGIKLN